MVGWVALLPSYVNLDIPLANNFVWWETHHTILSMVDSPGEWYVLRKCGNGSAADDGWQIVDEVVRHFERSIYAHGWTHRSAMRRGGKTEEWVLPESALLEQGCYEYRGKDDGSSVFLAVQPLAGFEKRFRIVLVTVRPSYWKTVMEEMD